MKPASAKNKGRKGQQYVRDKIYEKFPELEEGDVESRSMGANGTDIMLSPKAKKLFPYSVECKTIRAFVGNTYLAQSDANKVKGTTAIAIVKANHKPPVVVIKLDDFMELL